MEEKLTIKDIKENQILYFFSLSKWAGRIWEFNRSRIKIIRINEQSVRIDRIDDNQGKGNVWTMKKDKFDDYLKNIQVNQEIAWKKSLGVMKHFAEQSEEQLKGYTKEHPHYNWYVYTRDIFNDFYKLLQDGFSEEKYKTIKEKYVKFENALCDGIFKK